MYLKKPTYREIAEYIKKSEITVKGWKSKQSELLELVQIGALCKKNNINIIKLIDIIEFKTKMENATKKD